MEYGNKPIAMQEYQPVLPYPLFLDGKIAAPEFMTQTIAAGLSQKALVSQYAPIYDENLAKFFYIHIPLIQ